MNKVYLFLLAFGMSSFVQAEPFIPLHGKEVLEQLPIQLYKQTSTVKIKTLKTKLQANPDNWSVAKELAFHYINIAKAQADPRYMGYAQAVLQPWWNSSEVPIQALILRAVIKQNSHNFSAANADLDQVLLLQPGHVVANLIKATIATVQGNYSTAIQYCRQLMRRSSFVLSLVCQSTPASLSGKADSSYLMLDKILTISDQLTEKQSVWAWTSLAEIAWRLGKFDQAEKHFKTALQYSSGDDYLLRNYADFLLQQNRSFEVVKLLSEQTNIDSLLLRLAIAEKTTNSAKLDIHINILNQRFTANRKRGSSLHKGDEAKFKLLLLNQPQAALKLAWQNWQVQREAVDTYTLLQAAITVNDSKIISEVSQWLSKQGTKDVVIQQMLTAKEQSYEF